MKRQLSKSELRALNNQCSRESHRIRRHREWEHAHPVPVRASSNPPPTLTELRKAFDVRNESPENMIRLGSLMEDLEAAYPLGYRQDYDATLDCYWTDWDAPWQNGIKEFLRQDPFLFSKYKTLMRYKKLSSDFRDAIGLDDPNPATMVLSNIPSFLPEKTRSYALRILSTSGGKISFRKFSTIIIKFEETKNEPS